jgi:hypothetical protein
MNKKFLILWVTIFYAVSLSGCSASTLKPEQAARSGAVTLSPAYNLGQTFSAHYAGLKGVVLYLQPLEPGSGEIVLHLRRSPLDLTDLRSAKLDLEEVADAGLYAFKFPPLRDSFNSDYYLQLELNGSGMVNVGLGSEPEYLFGALYQNGIAQMAQLYFGLDYQSLTLFVGIGQEILTWFGWVIACLFLYTLPGWALLSGLWPGWRKLTWAEKLGLGSGVGLAFYPVLFMLGEMIGVRVGPWVAFIPGALGGVFLVWKNLAILLNARSLSYKELRPTFSFASVSKLPWLDLLLLASIALIFSTRLWAIRTIDVPMWGDSVQHTVMAQLILDHGGLFKVWEPYTPYQSLTVHFGFSAHVAIFSWLTGLPVHTSALITAQLINALAVIALLPLVFRFSPKNTVAAIGTLIVVGLLSTMPAFYVNWGRFAQLDGQAILPACIWLTWDILARGRENANGKRIVPARSPAAESSEPRFTKSGLIETVIPTVICGLCLAGMALGYYRMVFYYLTFWPALVIAWLFGGAYRSLRQWWTFASGFVWIGICALAFLLPWLVRVAESSLSGRVAAGMTSGTEISGLQIELMQYRELDLYFPIALLVLASLAIVWSLFRKRWDVTAISLWVVFLQAYHLGSLFQFPGAILLQVFAILIWLYMPAGLLCGWMIGEIADWFQFRRVRIGLGILIIVFLGLALYGANHLRLITRPIAFSLVTRPDLRAMAWIRQNTPPEARFLVEGWRIDAGSSAVGTDAGWWIPLFAGRQNTMPPQYALLNEVPIISDYSQRVVDLIAHLEEAPLASSENVELLCAEGITHVYIGQRAGKVGGGIQPLFSADEMINQPGFSLVYRQDRVFIFALDPSLCAR